MKCVYSPPEEGPDLFKKIADLESLESKGITIIAGDFNLQVWINKEIKNIILNPSVKN